MAGEKMRVHVLFFLLGCLVLLLDHAVSVPIDNEPKCSQQMRVGGEKMWVIDVLENHKCTLGPILKSVMGKNTPATTFSQIVSHSAITNSVCVGLIGVLGVAEKQQMMDAMCLSVAKDWEGVFCKKYYGGGKSAAVLKNLGGLQQSSVLPAEISSAITALASLNHTSCYDACGGGKGFICKGFVKLLVALLNPQPSSSKNEVVGEAPEVQSGPDTAAGAPSDTGKGLGDFSSFRKEINKSLPIQNIPVRYGQASVDSKQKNGDSSAGRKEFNPVSPFEEKQKQLGKLGEAMARTNIGPFPSKDSAGDSHQPNLSLNRGPARDGNVAPEANSRPSSPMLNTNSNLGQPQSSVRQSQTGTEQPQTSFGQLQMRVGQSKTSAGQPQLGFDQSKPNVGQPQTGFDQSKPNVGQPQTGFDQSKLNVGQPQPGLSQSQTNIVQPQTSTRQPDAAVVRTPPLGSNTRTGPPKKIPGMGHKADKSMDKDHDEDRDGAKHMPKGPDLNDDDERELLESIEREETDEDKARLSPPVNRKPPPPPEWKPPPAGKPRPPPNEKQHSPPINVAPPPPDKKPQEKLQPAGPQSRRKGKPRPPPVIKTANSAPDTSQEELYHGHSPLFFLTILCVVVISAIMCYFCLINKSRVRETLYILLTSKGSKNRREYR